MNKKMCLYFLVIVLLLTNLLTVNADDRLEVVYFKTEACSSCQKVASFLPTVINENIKILEYEILDKESRNLLYSYGELYDMEDEDIGVVPIIFIGEKYLLGESEIIENLEKEIEYSLNNNIKTKITEVTDKTNFDKQISQFNSFTFFTIFSAGFLDGFNPCTLAMLLFFISFVFATGKKSKEILFIGLSFVLGTFVAYFGIGLGLLKLTSLVMNAKIIMLIIYTLTILLSIGLAIFNFHDFIMIKKGKVNKIKNQLPQKIKHKIHNKIRSLKNNKFLIISSFVSGFVISFLEFFCTGQVYLPTITLILSLNPTNVSGILLLLLYNLAFVLPLIVVCILIYIGKEVVDLSILLTEKLHIIKLLSAIFFLIISFIILKQLLVIL